MGAGETIQVGRVAALWRYPVKSMAAEELVAAELSWDGIAGDRRWAFVRPGLEKSGFPWLTARERSDLCLYRPAFVDPSQPESSVTRVRTPGGATFDVLDPALAAELGDGVRVTRQSRGIFDAFPLSVLTTRSLTSLGARLGLRLDPLRFRPNLLLEALGEGIEAFPEERWVGASLCIGAAELRLDERDARCVMVNVDHRTATRDASVLRMIAQERGGCFGVYGTTVRPGHIAVGDAVTLRAAR